MVFFSGSRRGSMYAFGLRHALEPAVAGAWGSKVDERRSGMVCVAMLRVPAELRFVQRHRLTVGACRASRMNIDDSFVGSCTRSQSDHWEFVGAKLGEPHLAVRPTAKSMPCRRCSQRCSFSWSVMSVLVALFVLDWRLERWFCMGFFGVCWVCLG